MESVNKTREVERSRNLLETARLGEEAGTLLSQSRQALEKKDYEQSINFANQAEDIYSTLNVNHRLKELESYRSRAEEILRLREELE